MKYILILLTIFAFCKCSNDNDNLFNRSFPEQDLVIFNSYVMDSISETLSDSIYDLELSLPMNYDKTGNTDYTEIIQNVLDENRNVIFPGYPMLINSVGLTISSDSKIIFKEESKLILDKNSAERYEILRLHQIKNVELYAPNIVGDRNQHLGTTGEWGFGISIRGSQNIKVYQAEVKNCWGDGIYLGSIGDSLVNTDVKIEDCLIDNNRRNGISIISGINIDIVNCLISNTNGTAPEGGIDIEPNNNQEFLDNINIINVTTFNNGGTGLGVVLINFHGPNYKNVRINVKNHVDDRSLYGMGFAFGDLSNDYAKIEGNIDVVNSVWKNNKRGLVAFPDFNKNMISLNFIRAKALHNDSDISRKGIDELKRICEDEELFSFSE